MVKRIKDYLYGSSVVLSALQHRKRSLLQLFFNPQSKNQYLEQAIRLAEQNSVPVSELASVKLDRLSESRPNQGMVLMAGPLQIPSIQYLADVGNELRIETLDGPIEKPYNREYPFLLALDRIVDPQNLGAIIRTGYFYGIDGIVKTTKDSSPINAVVSKASAGAVEIMDLYHTNNLGTFLKKSSDYGWCIYGTDLASENVLELSLGVDIPKLLHGPTILVVGNEGTGMKHSLADLCDVHLQIEGYNKNQKGFQIDSLNVSVATGILIQKILE
jgi:21S rRNA (GM2251-2'-O)-methyltransferase